MVSDVVTERTESYYDHPDALFFKRAGNDVVYVGGYYHNLPSYIGTAEKQKIKRLMQKSMEGIKSGEIIPRALSHESLHLALENVGELGASRCIDKASRLGNIGEHGLHRRLKFHT